MNVFHEKVEREQGVITYETIAGQRFSVGSIGTDDLRFRIQNTTVDECRDYAVLLEKSGYCKRVEKEISAGTEFGYNVNLFYTFTNETKQVFLFWDASIHTTFITVEPLGVLPTETALSFAQNQVVSTTFTQLQVRSGMCYIVRLANGEYILIDGGEYDEDVKQLYDYLKENSPHDKPSVALWIFTHSHSDHIGAATRFIETYKDEIAVRAFAYQFPNSDKISVAMESVADMQMKIATLEKNIETNYPNALIYTLHTGQSYFFAGLEIEILWTIDDTYPSVYTSFNDMCVALRLKFFNGKSVLLLADCMHDANRRIAHRYGDYLKSDILQVAHHGLIGGDKNLYELVDPEICFWPTNEFVFLGEQSNQRYQWCLGEGGCDYNAYLRDKTIRERVHYHAGKTVTIEV